METGHVELGRDVGDCCLTGCSTRRQRRDIESDYAVVVLAGIGRKGMNTIRVEMFHRSDLLGCRRYGEDIGKGRGRI